MKIKELFSSKEKWIKGMYASNEEKLYTNILSPDAVCFCLEGALYRCYIDNKQNIDARKKIENSIFKLYPDFEYKMGKNMADNSYHLPLFNDHYSIQFKDIMAVVEDAEV